MSIDHIPKSAEEAIMMATNALSEEDKCQDPPGYKHV